MTQPAISPIHYRHIRNLGDQSRSTIPSMAPNQEVGVTPNHPRSVRKRFTFCRARSGRICHPDDLRTQAVRRGLKAQARSGARLLEHHSNEFAVQSIGNRLRLGLDLADTFKECAQEGRVERLGRVQSFKDGEQRHRWARFYAEIRIYAKARL